MEEMKLLGSLLDTEKDINGRKMLAIDAFKTLNKHFDCRKISNTVKIRTFNANVASVPYLSTTANDRTVDSHPKQ